VRRKSLLIIGLFLSWPLLAALLYFTSDPPGSGVTWEDANPGRGAAIATTGTLWMLGVLLFGIWKLVFSVIFPAIERAREKSQKSETK
jgi:hypothetical protein